MIELLPRVCEEQDLYSPSIEGTFKKNAWIRLLEKKKNVFEKIARPDAKLVTALQSNKTSVKQNYQ